MPSREEKICYNYWKKNKKGISTKECCKITGKTQGNTLNQLKGSSKTGMLRMKYVHSLGGIKAIFLPSTELINIMEKK